MTPEGSETESITYDGTIPSLHEVAAFVRQRGGSCTSPLAVEFGMEDAFRIATVHGARELSAGQRLDCRNGHFYVLATR